MQPAARRGPAALLLALAGVGLLLRCLAVAMFHGELTVDRDAYLGIAQQIAAGNGIADATTGQPTAFRPPLYPVTLAFLSMLLSWQTSVALLNIAAGTATVVWTWCIGRKLLPPWKANVAALLVAIDPLLLRYSSQPMTESLCTALVTLFVLLALGPAAPATSNAGPVRSPQAPSWSRPLATGVVFGLAVLCRPTILAVVPLYLLVTGISSFRGTAPRWASPAVRRALVWAIGAVLVLAPWAIRNAVVMGRPTVATTHGGYTLLLGNNPVYYAEVVAGPAGATWNGESLTRWQSSLERAMRNATPPVRTETERDRWMYRRAIDVIRESPESFAQACLLRCRRFWGLAPAGEAAQAVPGWLNWGVATFYLVVLSLALVGLVGLRGRDWADWRVLLVVAAAFWLVHLVYWSDIRMRAPIMPIVALLAARSLPRSLLASERGTRADRVVA